MNEETTHPTNPIAIAGLAFGVVALLLYVLAWSFVDTLPDSVAELTQLNASPSRLTRFVVTTGSAALINLVALSLSLTGLLLPQRPRLAAAVGSLLCGVMVIGIPGVIAVSLLFSR